MKGQAEGVGVGREHTGAGASRATAAISNSASPFALTFFLFMPSHNQHEELSEGENSRVSPRAAADTAVRFDRPCPRQGELVWLPPVGANPQPSAARLKFKGGIICL